MAVYGRLWLPRYKGGVPAVPPSKDTHLMMELYSVCACCMCGRATVLSPKTDRRVRGPASHAATLTATHTTMVISLAHTHKQALTHTPCYRPYAPLQTQTHSTPPSLHRLHKLLGLLHAGGDFSQEDTKSTGMKTAVSFWENARRCKAPLLHFHGNGGESMKCWSQSLKVTQSIHVLIIPLPYERNIASLVRVMKTHIRSFQAVYLFIEHGEPAVEVKTRKWTAHILVSLTKSQVEEARFQTITLAYYFWLGLFKWDKIGQNYQRVVSLG